MFRSLRLRRPSHGTVIAYLALFVALGGTAYAVNTVRSTDIVDGEVASVDIKDQDIRSADVKDQSLTTFDVSTFLGADIVDGTLTDKDVGSASYRNLAVDVGTISAHGCQYKYLGVPAGEDDHVILNPDFSSADSSLSYEVQTYPGLPQLSVCNASTAVIDDATTYFDVLVIKAG